MIETNPIALDKAVQMLRGFVKQGGVIEPEGAIKNGIEKGTFIINRYWLIENNGKEIINDWFILWYFW